ncbi:MAG TPA: hypothetical protein PK370_02825 [Candidatus Woesebacteria bacterium]|nr:hypothetical protein [Candidatus Woesebacteria bacterium]
MLANYPENCPDKLQGYIDKPCDGKHRSLVVYNSCASCPAYRFKYVPEIPTVTSKKQITRSQSLFDLLNK